MSNGFTLAEVLVIVVILSFIIAAIFAVLDVGNLTFRQDWALLELQQQARQAMAIMVKEIRQTNTIDEEGNLTIVSSSEVSFNIPSETYGAWIGPIEYYYDSDDSNNDGLVDQIIREDAEGSKKILANHISALNFSLSGNILDIRLATKKEEKVVGEVVIERELCYPTPCADPANTLKETVMLRN